MPSEDARTTTVDAIALLTVPDLGALSEQQVRGITCVWGGETLTTVTAVDLGVREAIRAGATVSWYPRACRSCLWTAALSKLHIHAPGCPECCKEETAPCMTGRVLYRLVREYGR